MDNHAEFGIDQASLVTCPTCRTRYSQAPPSGTESPRYRCNRCREVFVPGPGRASYRVATPGRPPVAGQAPILVGHRTTAEGGRMAIGMDDPSLADRVRSSALDEITAGEDRSVWTYRVSPDAEPAGHGTGGAEETAVGPMDDSFDDALGDAESVAPPGRPGVGGLVVALGLGAAGWAIGRFLAQPLAGDPVLWPPAGAVLGLLIGWMAIRWMARDR